MLSKTLSDRVLAHLGLDAPRADLDGLRALYAAWSAQIPFDNVRKLIALHENDPAPLPGTEPEDFLDSWLRAGTGGTCWAGSGALHALASTLGFDARRAAGSMRDLGTPNHGTTKVRIDEQDWLIDSSMLIGVPLPLGVGYYRTEASFGVEVEPSERGEVIWFDTPPHRELFPCRLLLDEVDAPFYAAAYERSRASSPFNQSLYARRNRGATKIVLRGATKFVRTAAGTIEEALDRGSLRESLRNDIGLSAQTVAAFDRCGALESCFTPVIGPNTAPPSMVPPSRRAAAAAAAAPVNG